MYIKNLSIENYRNYNSLYIDFDKNVNIILGDNGQGKTNLIEAIYLTSVGKSFKSIKDRELIKFDKDFFRIKSEYVRDGEDGKIDIYLSKLGKKAIRIDDININKISEIIDNVICVIFSPEDLNIVKNEPSNRRSFMDREISQIFPYYFKDIYNYKKILINKNNILKEKNPNKDMIGVYNLMLSELCLKIMLKRSDFIKKLNRISNKIHRDITNNKENLYIEYKPNIDISKFVGNKELSQLSIDENIKLKGEINNLFEKKIEDDLRRKISIIGCHKDDFSVFINEVDTRKFGSQGQQKTASLSLKLAEITLIKEEKGINPILLLDDVMSELDYERQKFLVNSIKNVQIFLTTTDISSKVMQYLPKGKVIYINKGQIVKVK